MATPTASTSSAKGPSTPIAGWSWTSPTCAGSSRTRVLDVLDHQLLNDLIENPTAEHIAVWIWDHLADSGLPIKEVRLHETSACYVVYAGA